MDKSCCQADSDSRYALGRVAAKILILLHERDRHAERTEYIVWELRDIWRERGLEILVQRGIRGRPAADAVIPNLDLTVVPTAYARFLDSYPTVLNRRVLDISKRKSSPFGATPGDGWQGPVIVKTDLNCGGDPERRLFGRRRMRTLLSVARLRLGALRRGRVRLHPLETATRLGYGGYSVFPSSAEVPPGVFRNPHLFVERFLPEREGDHYVLRSCSFLGSRKINLRRVSDDPVVKASRVISSEEVPAPPEIDALRRELGFDFGKFDYVLLDGKPFVFDRNRTPTYARPAGDPWRRHRALRLADGIEEFLPRDG